MLSWSSFRGGHEAIVGPGGSRAPKLRRGTRAFLFAAAFVALFGRVAPAQQIVEFDIPTANSKPLGIVAGPDGAIWFTFWFFSANNVELVVKVVDGRGFNGHFWVFYGALSDVEYSVTVTDMMTGSVKTYTNPYGRVASVADTAAFPESGPLRSLAPSPPPGQAAPAIGFTHPGSDATFNQLPLPTANSLPTVINKIWRPAIATSPAQCTTGPQNLCLNAQRFRVDVNWRVPPQGTSGVGTAMSLTEDTGYFWFFSSNNVELVIKVVDGRAFNAHFWVFYGALSDVEYTITVSDTLTGISKTYTNPQGQLASVADTAAF